MADLDERVSAKALALGLPKRAWRTIRWRDGRADPLRSIGIEKGKPFSPSELIVCIDEALAVSCKV